MENVIKLLNNEDLSKYTDLVKTVISRVLKKDKADVTFFDVVTIAMSVVEHIKQGRKLSGREKKDLAKSLLPFVVDVLIQVGRVNSLQSLNLKSDFLIKDVLIDQFIDMAAFLTNNPDLINAGKWILSENQEVIEFCCKDKCILL